MGDRPFIPGDKVTISYSRPEGVYRAEGTVVMTFEAGDYIAPSVVELFDGSERMIGRTHIRRLVFQKDNGNFVWAPEPRYRQIRKVGEKQ